MDSPPQKKVKLGTSAPGTPSTVGGGTPRAAAAGGGGGSGAGNNCGSVSVGGGGTTGDGLQKNASAMSNCNSIPMSQVSE